MQFNDVRQLGYVLRGLLFGMALTLQLGIVGYAQTAIAQTPPANPTVRTLYLIRHGAYDQNDERPDSVGMSLTPLGVAQVRLVANRLRSMPVTFTSIETSRLTRARESARVVAAEFPELSVRSTPVLNECTPPTWRADVMADLDSTEATDCREQLDRAFAEFASAPSDSGRHDILVCHGNVIRYFVTKTLNVDTMAWLGMGIGNASLTIIQVKTDGTSRLMGFSDVGHIPPNMQTGFDRATRELVLPVENPAGK